MQRNLGANAGLDYRELTDFLTAIIGREQAALHDLLGEAAAKLSTSSTRECCRMAANGGKAVIDHEDTALAAVLELPADKLRGQTAANGCTSAACETCCPSAASAGDDRIRCSELWQRTDCAAAVMQAIADEPRRATVLQTLFNLRRAHTALAELRAD